MRKRKVPQKLQHSILTVGFTWDLVDGLRERAKLQLDLQGNSTSPMSRSYLKPSNSQTQHILTYMNWHFDAHRHQMPANSQEIYYTWLQTVFITHRKMWKVNKARTWEIDVVSSSPMLLRLTFNISLFSSSGTL